MSYLKLLPIELQKNIKEVARRSLEDGAFAPEDEQEHIKRMAYCIFHVSREKSLQKEKRLGVFYMYKNEPYFLPLEKMTSKLH